jgi:hypothetical protein
VPGSTSIGVVGLTDAAEGVQNASGEAECAHDSKESRRWQRESTVGASEEKNSDENEGQSPPYSREESRSKAVSRNGKRSKGVSHVLVCKYTADRCQTTVSL